MHRDILVIPITGKQKTIIAMDCSGACGQRDLDVVDVSIELLAYYTARVAFMEIMSVRATPIAYTVSNFLKDGYADIHRGIGRLLTELKLPRITHITSTETNFDMVQSAMGISVIGRLTGDIDDDAKHLSFACAGSPLVGHEVIQKADKILPMNAFVDLVEDDRAVQLLPVGSKGIAYKLDQVYQKKAVASDVDLQKSAGPATCLLIGYRPEDQAYFTDKLKGIFHPIEIAK